MIDFILALAAVSIRMGIPMEKIASAMMYQDSTMRKMSVSGMNNEASRRITGVRTPPTAQKILPTGALSKPVSVAPNPKIPNAPQQENNPLNKGTGSAIKKPKSLALAKNPLNQNLATPVKTKPSGGPVMPGKNALR